MAVTVAHTFTCAIADNAAHAAQGRILPSHWNASHTVANAVDKTGDTMTGQMTVAQGTITTSQPFTWTQTWNAGAVTFTALKLNVTDTASAVGSALLTLQVGGYDKFYVWSDGRAFANQLIVAGSTEALLYGGLRVGNFSGVFWSSTVYYDGGNDTGLMRNAAGVVEVNNGTGGTYRDLLARNVRTNPTTVAGLTAAAQGARSFVTDATQTLTAGIGAIVAGGGANAVPVHYDGTNWRIG